MPVTNSQLKDYFEFFNAEDIRLKGTRIGIETILSEYIYRQKTPEQIAQIYPALTLEQVYATILYYLQNQVEVERYLSNWLDYCLQAEQEQDKNPPPSVVRLLKLKAEKNSCPSFGLSFLGSAWERQSRGSASSEKNEKRGQ